MTTDNASSSYAKAEQWCKSIIKKADMLLFVAEKFDKEMLRASQDLDFPLEVRIE